jgi:serine protease Do
VQAHRFPGNDACISWEYDMVKIVVICISLFLASPACAGFPAVAIYEKTAHNVVLIISKSEGTDSMIGSGSIISDTGIISTSAHVVIDRETTKPYSKIMVYIKPEKVTGKFRKDLVNRYPAKVMAYDADLDLAILKANDMPSPGEIIELADPGQIRVGDEVVAIGHPEQGGLWTLTYGRISGEIEDQNSIQGKDVFQTDASVNRGNSGGPLLDKRGYMIGINSNMARLGAGDVPITGVNFAVKSSVLRKWLKKQGIMIAYGTASLSGEETMSTPEAVNNTEAADIRTQDQTINPLRSDDEKKDVQQDRAEKVTAPKKEQHQKDKTEGPEAVTTEQYQPHHESYNYDALLKETEEELEDMMEEMRLKIRN